MAKTKSTWTFKEWWEKNKKQRNKDRRIEYHANPALQEEVREAARKNYRQRRKKMVPVDRLTIRDAQGNRYWSIGRIARMINRPIPTIRSYHDSGVIPEPAARDERGWRLYTTKQASLLRSLFKALDDPSETRVQALADITRAITPHWRD